MDDLIRRSEVLAVIDGASTGGYGYGEEGSGWYPHDPELVLDLLREDVVRIEAVPC